MKKALLVIIGLLLALSLAMVLFVVGMNWTQNNSSDDKEEKEKPQQYQTDNQSSKKKETEDAVKESTKKKEEPEKNEDEKKGIVLDEEDKEVEKNEEKESSETEEKWYRVRISANDAKSQKGAFQSLENAKALAEEYKDEGYKVFDGNKCIYTP